MKLPPPPGLAFGEGYFDGYRWLPYEPSEFEDDAGKVFKGTGAEVAQVGGAYRVLRRTRRRLTPVAPQTRAKHRQRTAHGVSCRTRGSRRSASSDDPGDGDSDSPEPPVCVSIDCTEPVDQKKTGPDGEFCSEACRKDDERGRKERERVAQEVWEARRDRDLIDSISRDAAWCLRNNGHAAKHRRDLPATSQAGLRTRLKASKGAGSKTYPPVRTGMLEPEWERQENKEPQRPQIQVSPERADVFYANRRLRAPHPEPQSYRWAVAA